ncbi:MAG: class I SAM-dependent methyltransferase [Elusimicrobia bacterium]|nr:class I SAM-dependent methyltransferase [Elusimicrobiota bacterium]
MEASILNKVFAEEKISKYDGLLAHFYDLDHQWRDYKKQTYLIKSLFVSQGLKQKIKILELCCGSGTHTFFLSQAGFEVLGVDSSFEMIRQARLKKEKEKVFPLFKQRDIFSLQDDSSFHHHFDCALLLGWTLSIQSLYERFTKILELARFVLKENGFFVFDITLNKGFNPSSSQPLIYETQDGMRGTLQIRSKENKVRRTMDFEYQWKINKGDGKSEQFFSVNEALAIVERDDVLLKISSFKDQFEILHELSGYSLNFLYKKGDKNLVMVLRKALSSDVLSETA